MIIDELVAVLGFKLEGEADRRKFEQGLKRAEGSLNKFSQSVTDFSRKAVLSIGAIGGALGAVFAKSVVGVNAQFEGFAATLETIEGSAEKARKSLDWVSQFAKTTPYEVAEVTDAFVRLRAYGMDPMDGTLKALGDTASGMGKSLMQAVEAMADAATGEFERLKEFGIKASTAGDQVTFSWQQNGKEFRETVAKNGTEITKFLRDTLGGRFQGAMERQSKTWTGLVSNLSDSWVDFQRRIGEAGFFDAIKKRLEGLLATVARLSEDGTLDRWATNISNALETVANAFDYVASQVSDNVATLNRLWSENRNQFEEYKTALLLGIGLILKKLFPFWFWLGLVGLAINDFLKYLEGAPSVIGDFINSLAWFLGTEPETVAEALGAIVKAAAGIAGIAFGVGLLAGAFRKLTDALRGLSKFAGFLGRLAGFKWGAAAAGAAAVAGAAGTAAAAGAGGTAATGAGAGAAAAGAGAAAKGAGAAASGVSKAPWLPGGQAMSWLGRVAGKLAVPLAPLDLLNAQGDFAARVERYAKENGGDMRAAFERAIEENRASDRETAQSILQWFGSAFEYFGLKPSEKVEGAVRDGSETTKDAVRENTEATEGAVRQGAEVTSEAVRKGGEATGDAVREGAAVTSEATRKNAEAVQASLTPIEKSLKVIEDTSNAIRDLLAQIPGFGWMGTGGSGGDGGYVGSPAHGAEGARSMGGPYSDELAAAIRQSAAELGVSPEDLATAISYETAGTFDPWKRGPTTKWGTHRGLIQWGEPQRRQYGVTRDSTVGEQMRAVTAYLKDRGVKPGHGLMQIYSAINAGGVGSKFYGRSDAHAGGAPGSVRDKVNTQMHAHRAKARRLLAQEQREVVTADASTMLQNYQGNTARMNGSAQATSGTLARSQTTVTQTIQVGDVHAAPGEKVDRATARAVGGAAANASRAQQLARIAGEPAARP
jgi:hypothetical protein